MFYRTDDPNKDFDRWDAHQERQLARLPRCIHCKERIQDEDCYEFEDGVVCPDCVDEYISEHNKRKTEHFIGGD